MSTLRTAELLSAFARAGDLGLGFERGHVFRTTVIALAVAEHLGLPDAQRQAVYETGLLMHGGCTAGNALLAAYVACDEIRAKKEMCVCDPDSIVEVLAWVGKNVAPGAPLPERIGRMLKFLASAERELPDVERGCADVGGRIATRLGLSHDAARSLDSVCERWNGKGARKLKGAHIPLPARIVQASMIAEVFLLAHGRDAAIAALGARSGRSLDPTVVGALLAVLPASGEALSAAAVEAHVLEREPAPTRMEASKLDEVALAFADFVDLKSERTGAHARATGALAAEIAEQLGHAPDQVTLAQRAGWLHDVGKVGVPTFLLEKPTLHAAEEAQVALHVLYAEQLLAGVPMLAPIAAIAALHHERLDGSGYPKGLRGDAIPLAARVVAVADGYDERLRAGATSDAALAATRAEAGLDVSCLEALAAVLAQQKASVAPNPGGLSDRELEVLRVIASGLTVKEVGAQLFLSPHTVRHHLEHVYEKIGVTSRAGAVLYAMEHGILR